MKHHSPAFLSLVSAAKSQVNESNVGEIKRRMDEGGLFRLIDVREDNEWAQGHLPGAIHLGKGIIERDIEKAVPDKSAVIVLYCGGGYRSVLAAESLQKMGYSGVISMDGGYSGWREAGYPVVKD